MEEREERKIQNEKHSVMLVDDHPLLLKGLKQLLELEDDIEVIAEANNGEEAVTKAIEHDPDLIVLDLNMQGLDGIQTLKKMRKEAVTSRIVMLTVSDDDADIVEAISSGADGYLLKDMDPEELLDQLRKALDGKMALSESLTEVLATAIRKPSPRQQANVNHLTNREFEILNLIAEGMSNKVIARELGISDGTVKVHVKHLLKKLNLRSRVEAAVWIVHQRGNK